MRLMRSMRPIRLGILAAMIAFSPAALADWRVGSGGTGNDTGGIIPWSPDVDHVYRDIAGAYCARWNRVARITSVHRQYGDFIGFMCLYDRRYDPRNAWWLYWHGW